MSVEPWKCIATTQNQSYRIFNLRTDRARSPRTDKVYDFYIMESLPWVNVIPLTSDNEVVLIRQYRHGTKNVTLEIPGGIVEGNDTAKQAAVRELKEETGYGAREMISLGWVHPNPAIQDNQCFTFLAKDAYRVGDQALDEKEDIDVLLRPLSKIPELIRTGDISHALVVVAFYRFFNEYQPQHF